MMSHEAVEKIIFEGMETGVMEYDGVPCENPWTHSETKFFFDLGRKIGRAVASGEYPAKKRREANG